MTEGAAGCVGQRTKTSGLLFLNTKDLRALSGWVPPFFRDSSRAVFLPPLRHRHKPRMIPDNKTNTPEEPTMKTSILASLGTCAILAAGAALLAPSSPHAQGAAPRYEFDASW